MKKLQLTNEVRFFVCAFLGSCLLVMNVSGQNIGIGTDTPADKLHIYGGDLRIEDNYPFIFLNKFSASTNTGINFKVNDVSKGFLVLTGIDDVLRMTTDGDGLRNDLMITNIGKVCIGTSSPHEFSQLHVAGGDLAISDEGHPFLILNSLSTNNNGGITMQENGVNKGWFYLDGGYDRLRMSTSSGGGRDDFAMDSQGNIGIGISNPSEKLHVSGGKIRIDNDSSYLFLNATNAGNGGIGFKENGTNTAWIFFKGAENLIKFSNSNTGLSNDLTINSVGKVGIGTGTPGNKLHVFGGDAEIEDYYPYLYLNDTTPAGGKAGIGFQYLGASRAIINYDITGDYIKLSTDDNGTRNDIIVTSSGNIGMGTSSPAATNKLQVIGGDIQVDDDFSFVLLNSNVSGNNAGVGMKENGVGTGWIFYNSTLDVLKLSTASNGVRTDLAITPSGNVGIGTETPTSALHVEGTIEVDQKIQADDAGGLEFATEEGTTRMRVLDDGNIAIGTTTVAAGSRMHISGGDLTVEESATAYLNLNTTSSTGTSGIAFKEGAASKGWISYSNSLDFFRISTDPTNARHDLVINSTGDIGFGNSAPAERLHVKATGAAKIRVEGSGSNTLALEFFNLSTFGGSVGYSITNDYVFLYHGGNIIVKGGSLGVGQNTIAAGRKIDVAGGAYCSGTNWVNSSDRSLKENLMPVSGKLILEKIQNLDITSWNYREEGTGTRHIGPMAQEFYSLFEVGYDDTSISTLDADGISLAAIKALAEENRELKARMEELEIRLKALEGLASFASDQNSSFAQQ